MYRRGKGPAVLAGGAPGISFPGGYDIKLIKENSKTYVRTFKMVADQT